MAKTTGTILHLPDPPKQTYSVRLPAQVWEDLTRIGAKTKRSRSNLVEIALEEFIRKHGDVMTGTGS